MHAVKRRTRPRRLGFRLVAVGLALAALGSACSRSAYVYVSSSDHQAYFKVPGDWALYSRREILVATGQNPSPTIANQNKWLIGFDSNPDPHVEDVVYKNLAPKYPVVFAQMLSLGTVDQDHMSLIALRNFYYEVDSLLNKNQAGVLEYKDLVLDGGFHGSHMVYDIFGGGAGDVSAENVVLRVNQTILVDAATKTLYLLIIRCESHCYRANKALIDQIAQSWTVKER